MQEKVTDSLDEANLMGLVVRYLPPDLACSSHTPNWCWHFPLYDVSNAFNAADVALPTLAHICLTKTVLVIHLVV